MSASDRPRPETRDRLIVEAVALGGLLLLCAVAHTWLGSRAGVKSFAVEPAFARLTSGAWGKIRREGDTVVVRGAAEKPTFAMLDAVSLERDERYLLALEVGAGLGYRFQALDRDSKPVLEFRLPPRAGTEERLFVLDANALPDWVRFRLVNRWQEEIRLERAELYRLSSAYPLARRAPCVAGLALAIVFGVRHRHRFRAYFRVPDAVGDRLVAAGVAVVCLVIYHQAGVNQIADSKYITAASHSLLRSGSLALPPELAALTNQEAPYHIRRVGDRLYHFFPNAPAVLNAPVVAVYGLFGVAPVGPDGTFFRHHEARILRFTAALIAAALCGLLYLLGRLWLPPGHALALVVVFAFGSQIFSTISRPYWSHAWAVLLATGGLYLLASPAWSSRASAYAASATLFSWAFFCRPTMALSVAAATVLVACTQRRQLVPFVVTGLGWLALFVVHSQSVYGQALPPYTLSWHLESGHLGDASLGSGYVDGALGTLFSPGRGLFVFVPFLLCVMWIVVRRWRLLPSRLLASLAAAVFLAHWQLLSQLSDWWGGQSFGPRLFSDVIPWFFVLAAMAVYAFREALRNGSVRWAAVKLAGLGLVVAASVFVNARGGTASETWRWRSYEVPPRWYLEGREPLLEPGGMWNWRYPQFMAGLVPKEQPRGRG